MSYTLADIQKAAEKKYGNFKLEVIEGEFKQELQFRPVLRLSKAERTEYARQTNPLTHVTEYEGLDEEAIEAAVESQEIPEANEDIVDVMLKAVKEGFRITARPGSKDFELLDKHLKNEDGEDDLGLWQALYEAYAGQTEAGEA
jgi:hypothetical protein